MDTNKRTQNGFTLVEVMLAVLVLGVGILAVSNLQGKLIRSGAEANERSVASNLVEKKIDDLRRFIHLTTSDAAVPDTWSAAIVSPNSVAYEHIADNAGGLIGSGTITIGNINYDLSWDVDDYYFAGSNVKATTTPSGADYPSYKTAHVKAVWDSVSSTNNVVSFDTVINAYNPLYTTLGGSTPVGSTGPIIPYTPQTAPDVVPVTIGDDGVKKETSKPEPDLSKKGESTTVRFETVTYNLTLDTLRREEFRTFVCLCQNGADTSQQVYGVTTWDDTLEKIIDVTTIQNKTISNTAVDNSGGEDQDDDCFICCRDGDDVSGTDYKVCRMKRVDGVLRMFQPWKLIGFNVIPASYFNDSDGLPDMTTTLQQTNIAQYSSYVTDLVRTVLTANATEPDYNSYTTVDTSFITNTSTYTNVDGPTTIDHLAFTAGGSARQYQARAIYLDYPPTGIYTQIVNQSTFYTPATVPLDRIPFYEVNLTRLAGWIPDREKHDGSGPTLDDGDLSFVIHYTSQHDDIDNGCDTSVSVSGRSNVSNDAIENTCEQLYSRGEFDPQIAGTTTVTTRIFTNSDGVIDRNVNPGNVSVDSAVGLTVSP